jgi:hypothetical protein
MVYVEFRWLQNKTWYRYPDRAVTEKEGERIRNFMSETHSYIVESRVVPA